jgi:hypothetical protein
MRARCSTSGWWQRIALPGAPTAASVALAQSGSRRCSARGTAARRQVEQRRRHARDLAQPLPRTLFDGTESMRPRV